MLVGKSHSHEGPPPGPKSVDSTAAAEPAGQPGVQGGAGGSGSAAQRAHLRHAGWGMHHLPCPWACMRRRAHTHAHSHPRHASQEPAGGAGVCVRRQPAPAARGHCGAGRRGEGRVRVCLRTCVCVCARARASVWHTIFTVCVAAGAARPQVLLPWAQERGLGKDLAALCANPHVKEAVFKSMQVRGQAGSGWHEGEGRGGLGVCPGLGSLRACVRT